MVNQSLHGAFPFLCPIMANNNAFYIPTLILQSVFYCHSNQKIAAVITILHNQTIPLSKQAIYSQYHTIYNNLSQQSRSLRCLVTHTPARATRDRENSITLVCVATNRCRCNGKGIPFLQQIVMMIYFNEYVSLQVTQTHCNHEKWKTFSGVQSCN